MHAAKLMTILISQRVIGRVDNGILIVPQRVLTATSSGYNGLRTIIGGESRVFMLIFGFQNKNLG